MINKDTIDQTAQQLLHVHPDIWIKSVGLQPDAISELKDTALSSIMGGTSIEAIAMSRFQIGYEVARAEAQIRVEQLRVHIANLEQKLQDYEQEQT